MKLLGKLFLLFTVVTIIEVYLLVLLTHYTNIWVTIAFIVVPGILGAFLARREGRKAFAQLRAALRLEQEPTGAVLDGAVLLVAAAFLITPGVLTDITGLLLMLPPVRRPIREYARRRIHRAIENRLSSGLMKFFVGSFDAGAASMGADKFSRYEEDKVIDIKPER
jgi:UPF0716 protein FxsA